MADTKLQTVIDKQLPEFIREDYSKFVQFLKAYYKYLDIVDKRDLEELRDIDSTLYDYIIFINNELGYSTFPNAADTNIDPRLFLRKSKLAFTSKGTEESFKFLFKVLYNKEVQISYPWDSVFKPSDGKWNQDISIFVEFPLSVSQTQVETTVNSYVGNNITINGPSISVSVYVKKVKFVRDRVYEVSIDKRYYGNIEPGSTITQNNITSTLLNTTVGYEIVSGGKNFLLGDLLVGNTISGSQVITQLIKVTKISNDGAIQKISTIAYNGGYGEEFFLLASKQNVQTTSASLNLTTQGATTDILPPILDDTNVDKYSDYGYIINADYYPIQDSFLTCTGTITVANNSKDVFGTNTRFNDNSSPSTQQVNVGDVLQTSTGTVIGTVASIQSATRLTLVANATPARTNIAFRIPVTTYGDPGYVGTNLRSYYEDTFNNSSQTNTEEFALIAFKIGAVAKYQGYYIANDGFLSDDIRIQDSKYYQKYSYLLTANEKFDTYKGYVNSYIHPAGVKGFAEYQIQESYTPVIEATQALEVYNSKSTFRTINKDIINDFVSPMGVGGRIKKNTFDLEGYMQPDYNVDDYITFTEA